MARYYTAWIFLLLRLAAWRCRSRFRRQQWWLRFFLLDLCTYGSGSAAGCTSGSGLASRIPSQLCTHGWGLASRAPSQQSNRSSHTRISIHIFSDKWNYGSVVFRCSRSGFKHLFSPVCFCCYWISNDASPGTGGALSWIQTAYKEIAVQGNTHCTPPLFRFLAARGRIAGGQVATLQQHWSVNHSVAWLGSWSAVMYPFWAHIRPCNTRRRRRGYVGDRTTCCWNSLCCVLLSMFLPEPKLDPTQVQHLAVSSRGEQ